MKLLIAYGSKGKFFHLNEFANALSKFGVESKLVKDTDYSIGFPSKSVKNWFCGDKKIKQLISEFKPDAIFVDRQTHFCIHAIKTKIPVFVLLRGHYWSELYYAKKTIHRGLVVRVVIWFRNRIAEKCFRNATAILPICKYLERVVREHHPQQLTSVFLEGINSSHWYHVKGMKLKHPCIGFVQDANWWGKTKEMLILPKVLKTFPNVNFYWAGDGPYREMVLSKLKKFENFHWLGRLQYPDKVREFLTEIDVYALVTGMDLAPLTLKEAQLMEKPVIATNVGGVSEMMEDGKSGFLVEEGNPDELIEKISVLLNDEQLSSKMGKSGREFVINTFNWEVIAKKFLKFIEPHIKI